MVWYIWICLLGYMVWYIWICSHVLSKANCQPTTFNHRSDRHTGLILRAEVQEYSTGTRFRKKYQKIVEILEYMYVSCRLYG